MYKKWRTFFSNSFHHQIKIINWRSLIWEYYKNFDYIAFIFCIYLNNSITFEDKKNNKNSIGHLFWTYKFDKKFFVPKEQLLQTLWTEHGSSQPFVDDSSHPSASPETKKKKKSITHIKRRRYRATCGDWIRAGAAKRRPARASINPRLSSFSIGKRLDYARANLGSRYLLIIVQITVWGGTRYRWTPHH